MDHVPEVKENELKGKIIVDVRAPSSFSAGHIPGSVNIPLGPSFRHLIQAYLPAGEKVVFTTPSIEYVAQIQREFENAGLNTLVGYILLNETNMKEVVDEVSVKSLVGGKWYILDVRTQKEWDAGHIEGAKHIELSELPVRINEIPADVPIGVICHSGNRSAIGAAYLKSRGYTQAANVHGGMIAWAKKG